MKPLGGSLTFRALITRVAVAVAASSALLATGTVFASATTPELVIGPGEPIATREGTQLTNQVVGTFTDSGLIGAARPLAASAQQVNECDAFAQARYTVGVDWLGNGNFTSNNVTVTCGDGAFVISGTYTYKDSGTFQVSVSVKDNEDDKTAAGQSDTAAISDREISSGSAANVTGAEGDTVSISAAFADANTAFSQDEGVDPGLSATIDWGDGSSPTSGTIEWNDSNTENVLVTGSHVYDANTPPTKAYDITVKLQDDGNVEAQARDTLSATIADATLTAGTGKSFAATATKSSSQTVASFTDAAGAQAAAADFTASINWGDSTTSSGTVTKTGSGAFSVSGTHTYATQGSKSLTITVTDEEGQTVSMTASATVAAAPIVLPLTGQSNHAATPGAPIWPLALVLLGLWAIAAGFVINRFARIGH